MGGMTPPVSPPKGGSAKWIVTLVIVVLLALLGYWWYTRYYQVPQIPSAIVPATEARDQEAAVIESELNATDFQGLDQDLQGLENELQ